MSALVRIVSNRPAYDPTVEEVERAYDDKFRDADDEEEMLDCSDDDDSDAGEVAIEADALPAA